MSTMPLLAQKALHYCIETSVPTMLTKSVSLSVAKSLSLSVAKSLSTVCHTQS